MQDREREVLELPFDRGHTEAVRQRRDDLEGFLGLLRLLLRRQEAHGAHVVQAVGHLDHQYARVTRHGNDHLADGLGLGGGTQVDLVEFGDAVDQMCDLGAEVLGQLLE